MDGFWRLADLRARVGEGRTPRSAITDADHLRALKRVIAVDVGDAMLTSPGVQTVDEFLSCCQQLDRLDAKRVARRVVKAPGGSGPVDTEDCPTVVESMGHHVVEAVAERPLGFAPGVRPEDRGQGVGPAIPGGLEELEAAIEAEQEFDQG